MPDPEHVNSTSATSLKYCASVFERCDESIRIYENQDGGRDVFALESVIVKSSHLKDRLEGRLAHRDYSFADANEMRATALVRKAGADIRVPDIYFVSKVRSIPGPQLRESPYYVTTLNFLCQDQWSRRLCPGENSWSWLERPLAIHLSIPKGIFQAASTGRVATFARDKTSRLPKQTLLHRPGPRSSRTSTDPKVGERHYFSHQQRRSGLELHAQRLHLVQYHSERRQDRWRR
jgi:hypothetical protein